MEPLITAGAFATIIGLICNFKNERRSVSENEYDDFVGWLNEKQHNKQINKPPLQVAVI